MIPRAAALLAVLLAGCAPWGAVRSALGPTPEVDDRLRALLAAGQADSAVALLNAARSGVGDALLRELQRAVALHEAGHHAESNAALDRAEREIDRRFTRSVSRAAGSLAVNDALLAYQPAAPERAMIPVYRMLNFWALGDSEGAVVEARKAGALVAAGDLPCASAGLLAYLSGMAFAAEGEYNPALVSLRQADRAYVECDASAPPRLGADLVRLARALGMPEIADDVARRYGPAQEPGRAEAGELVVWVAHGFVPARVHQELHVPIFADEYGALASDHQAAARVSARLLDELDRRDWQDGWGSALDGAHVFKLAWPALRAEGRRPTAVQVMVGDSVYLASPVHDLSTGVRSAWERQRPAVMARALARALLRYKLAREAEQKADKQGGEDAGWIVGRLVNAAGNALERADTRAWTLLPDQLAVARVPVPPGVHRVRLRTLGPDGEVLGEADLGTTNVRPGGRTLLSRRVWGREPGEPGRLARSRCTGSETPPSESAPGGSSGCR